MDFYLIRGWRWRGGAVVGRRTVNHLNHKYSAIAAIVCGCQVVSGRVSDSDWQQKLSEVTV